jgi:hypothetical protein
VSMHQGSLSHLATCCKTCNPSTHVACGKHGCGWAAFKLAGQLIKGAIQFCEREGRTSH